MSTARIAGIHKCVRETFRKNKGEINITSSPFTNCGLRHIGLPCGGYTLDQIEYVNALKPIVTEEVSTSKAKALGTTSAEADKRQLASIEKGTKEAD